jgi:hypothetical protein
MFEPFHSILNDRNAKALRMVIAIFERKVRSGRGRAVTKAQQANIDEL